jgi:hypothetical protein
VWLCKIWVENVFFKFQIIQYICKPENMTHFFLYLNFWSIIWYWSMFWSIYAFWCILLTYGIMWAISLPLHVSFILLDVILIRHIYYYMWIDTWYICLLCARVCTFACDNLKIFNTFEVFFLWVGVHLEKYGK